MKLLTYSLSLLLLLNSCASIKENRQEYVVKTCAIVGILAGTAYAFKNDGDNSNEYTRELSMWGGALLGYGVGYGFDWIFFERKNQGSSDERPIPPYRIK